MTGDQVGAVRANLNVVRRATVSAIADLRLIYTWRTWLFAWLPRVLSQVCFYALIGRLLGAPAEIRYLLIGNSVFVVASSAMLVCVSTIWERHTGTLPLLVAAPSSPFFVFAGRSVQWLVDGTVAASLSIFLLAPLFGLPLPLPGVFLVPPLILLTGLATYCFALALAGLVLRVAGLANLVSTVAGLVLMTICGVQVPVSFWPRPVQVVATGLPLAHGLAAIRAMFTGATTATVLRLAGFEAVVGLAWLVVAWCTFGYLAQSGRKNGSIEYSAP